MTDSHSQVQIVSPSGGRRVIFPELRVLTAQEENGSGSKDDPCTCVDQTKIREGSFPSPTLAVASTAQGSCSFSEQELEFYSSLPSIEMRPRSSPVSVVQLRTFSLVPDATSLSSPRSPLSSSSSRRKIFDFESAHLTQPFPSRFRRSSILKPSSYPRPNSIPSLASTTCEDDEQDEQCDEPVGRVRGTDSKGNKVFFHPRVTSCEFHRSQEELQTTWWSAADMESFQLAAMVKVLQMGGTPNKALFTHPALAR